MSAATDRFFRDCEAIGLGKPYPEYRFDSSRRWRFDYAFQSKIAIEISGAAHDHANKRKKDYEKVNAAQADGWIVLQFTPQEIRDGSWMEAAINAVLWRAEHPETVVADPFAAELPPPRPDGTPDAFHEEPPFVV